ncbi:hypothetical protein EWB00_000001 [Schistosoma japonicum]|uniref:Uncharacterized protein n=1 Tax=Schistosoma japonicum TaxID=6182 RepID=A0A4Z2DYG0_SCHJA|nr:hypothetical protein EWB00_000001 [Schistosoma japonicum]
MKVDYGPICTININDYEITSQLKPTNLTLQPGQKTTINMQYIFPLNSSYPKSTIQVIGTGPNSTNETIMTIIGFTITWGRTVIVPHVRNTINITVDIQLSDSRSVEKGTTWPLQFIDIVSVYCWRSGSEVPSINVSLSQVGHYPLSVTVLTDMFLSRSLWLPINVHVVLLMKPEILHYVFLHCLHFTIYSSQLIKCP